jgi:hypothetical protein
VDESDQHVVDQRAADLAVRPPAHRQDRFGVELHGRDRQALVAHGHHDAGFVARQHVELAVRERRFARVEGVVGADGARRGQALEQARAVVHDVPALAVARLGQYVEGTPERLDRALQAEANAELRDAAAGKGAHQGRHAELRGRAGPRRMHDEVGLQREDRVDAEAVAVGRDRRPRLAEIVGERVDEAVLVVDHDDVEAGTDRVGRVRARRRGGRGEHAEERVRLQVRLLVLLHADRIPDQRGAHTVAHTLALALVVVEVDGADRDAGVDVAVEQQGADGPAVPAARCGLGRLDDLDRPFLRRTRQRHGPHVADERVEARHVGPQAALDMVDRVEEAGVGLDLAPAEQLHRTRHADARLVVPVDVGAHRELDLVLLGIDQRLEALGVLHRVAPAPRRARDRAGLDAIALDAHEHLGAGAHEPVGTELQEELERRGVDLLELREQRRRGALPRRLEAARQHDLEDVAHAHALARDVDHRGVFRGRQVGRDLGLGRRLGVFAPGQRRERRARFALGGRRPAREVVVVAERRLLAPVEDVHAVGQEQVQVARLGRPRVLQRNRLELEQQVVAERAVEAEERVGEAGKLGHDAAQGREQRGLLASLLLGEGAGGGDDLDVPLARRGCRGREVGEYGVEQRQQRLAARVEGAQGQRAVAPDDLERRVDEAELPARIAPRIVDARREQPAAGAVEALGEAVEGGGVVERPLGARQRKAGP